MLKSTKNVIEDYTQELKNAKRNLMPLKNIQGFSGFRRNGINIVGARPFVGVTDFLVSIANELARKGEKTLFVSTRLSENEIVKRSYALASGIPVSEVRSNLTSRRKVLDKLYDNLFIYETKIDECKYSAITIGPLLITHKIKNLIIDSTEEELYGLHTPIDNPKVTMIVGKLLGKSADKNSDGRPKYKDFLKRKINMRPVNMVVGLSRIEYYNIVRNEAGNSTEGMAELVVIKSPFEEANAVYKITQDRNFSVG